LVKNEKTSTKKKGGKLKRENGSKEKFLRETKKKCSRFSIGGGQ